MRLLCVGDVFSECGVNMLLKTLPALKKSEKIDLCIVNGENSAVGNGITKESAERIFAAGADVITGGNHSLRQESVLPFYDECPFLLRPDNIKCDCGGGYLLYDMGRYSVAVINLLGRVYLEKLDAENPFAAADRLIKRAKEDGARFTVVDFHAEATSEKRAMGFYLDGRVSAVFGTHTHVPTADCQVLPQKTGYITDLGMTGVKNSVLGVKKEIIIKRLLENDQSKFIAEEGNGMLCGAVFELDDNTGLCLSAKQVYAE